MSGSRSVRRGDTKRSGSFARKRRANRCSNGHDDQIADPPQKGPTLALISARSSAQFYRILTGGAMCLFLVIVWGFGAFNSRLGGKNSRLGRLREFARNGLISPAVFPVGWRLYRENQKNSRFHGNNREFFPAHFFGAQAKVARAGSSTGQCSRRQSVRTGVATVPSAHSYCAACCTSSSELTSLS